MLGNIAAFPHEYIHVKLTTTVFVELRARARGKYDYQVTQTQVTGATQVHGSHCMYVLYYLCNEKNNSQKNISFFQRLEESNCPLFYLAFQPYVSLESKLSG
jgi:hypothetical protein